MATSLSAGSLVPPASWDSPSQVARSAGSNALSLAGQGRNISATGMAGLQPVLDRLTKLLSGDQAAVNEATLPERKSVLEQFDTARKSAAEFSPKGGSQASSVLKSYADEAGQIASIKSGAITKASSDLGTIATQLLGIGGEEMASGINNLVGLVQAAIQQKGQTQQLWGDIGTSAGSIIGSIILGSMMAG